MPSGFQIPPELPEGVSDLLALTKYSVDYSPPKFNKRGARSRDTGGYVIVTSDGTAHRLIKPDATSEEWQQAIGQLLDSDLRWAQNKMAEVFRDPIITPRKI